MFDFSKKTTEELRVVLDEYFIMARLNQPIQTGGLIDQWQKEFGQLYPTWIGFAAHVYFERTHVDYLESVVSNFQRNMEQQKVVEFVESDPWQ